MKDILADREGSYGSDTYVVTRRFPLVQEGGSSGQTLEYNGAEFVPVVPLNLDEIYLRQDLNLSDVDSAATSRANLGITSLVTGYAADAGAGVTALDVQIDGALLADGEPGMPVIQALRAMRAAIAFAADVTTGDWTLHLDRKPDGSNSWSEVATITIPL